MLDHRFWERYFRVYDVLNSVPTYTQLLDSVCRWLDPRDGALVLDVGSGTGNLALKLKASGCRVIAIDFCRQALEIHGSRDPGCSVLLTDLRMQLPFKDNSFDGITCNNVLYTLSKPDQDRLAREFHRVLRPGGKVAVANPRVGWQARAIYANAVRQTFRAEGAWPTAARVVRQIVPTIRMLYYNRMLARDAQFHYFEPQEQLELLRSVGFRQVSDTTLVYAGQVVLNSACK